MNDLNKVILIGRLTCDADLKYTSAGTPVSNFSIAVNKSIKKGNEWENEASFFDVNLWGGAAENLSKHLKKGKQIAIEGSLKQSRWLKDGKSHSRISVEAQSIQLLGGNVNKQSENKDYSENEDDIDGIPF